MNRCMNQVKPMDATTIGGLLDERSFEVRKELNISLVSITNA